MEKVDLKVDLAASKTHSAGKQNTENNQDANVDEATVEAEAIDDSAEPNSASKVVNAEPITDATNTKTDASSSVENTSAENAVEPETIVTPTSDGEIHPKAKVLTTTKHDAKDEKNKDNSVKETPNDEEKDTDEEDDVKEKRSQA